MRAAVVAMVALLAACGDKAAPKTEAPVLPEPDADAVTSDSDAGPARVQLKVWPKHPTLGDSIWLRLEVDAQPGVVVEMPFDQAALGRFKVLGYTPESARTDAGGERRVDTYELAAPMSGRHRIPPMRVVVHDGRTAADAGVTANRPIEILTDEIPLEVGGVLTDKTDQELRPARGAIATEVGGRIWWPLIVGIASGLGVLGLILTWMLLRKRAVRRGQVSAWQLAMRRLADLEARGAPGADAADGWFVELSGVIRAYVEGRYRLRAPELTTEEFLAEARRLDELTAGHRDTLSSFLERCDRVKFAGWRPESDESLEVLAAARGFVEATRLVDPAAPRSVPTALAVQP